MRAKMDLGGWEGAPGVNVYHFEVQDQINTWDEICTATRDLLHSAYDGVKSFLLGGLTAVCNTEFLELDAANNELKAVHTISPSTPITGSGTQSETSRATMALVRHYTDAVHNGRRLNGRTYIGPIARAGLGTNGHLTPSAVQAFSAMYDGMQDIAGITRLVVYHRPKEDAQGNQIDDGMIGHVQQSTAWEKPGVLRSRRD